MLRLGWKIIQDFGIRVGKRCIWSRIQEEHISWEKKAGKMNFSVRGLRWALTICFSLEEKSNIKLLESKLSLWKPNLFVYFISIFWLTKRAINIEKDFEQSFTLFTNDELKSTLKIEKYT